MAVGTRRSDGYRARRLQPERQPRQTTQEQTTPPRRKAPAGKAGGAERRAAAQECGWCGGPITPRSRGPIAKWCSATCRHRAWEQARAAAAGLSAVEVVERHVEVAVPLAPGRRDWPGLLAELAEQLEDGRVYDRDVPSLGRALGPVVQAYRWRARGTGAPNLS